MTKASSDSPEAFDLAAVAFEQAPAALLMTDRDLRITAASERWRSLMGLSPDVVGQSLHDVVPLWAQRRSADLSRALAGETPDPEHLKMGGEGNEGRWLRIDLTPWRDEAAAVGGILLYAQDTTEEVLALERIERSEARLKLAIDIADLLVYEVDYSAGTLEWHGPDTFFDPPLTYDELSEDIWAAVHPNDREAARATWREQRQAGQPFRTEYRIKHRQGKEVWVFGGTEAVPAPNGGPGRLVGVLQNINTRRLAEEQAREARDAAEAANRAKSEFLANMSHEIRTPLNGVMGVASVLARTDLTSDQVEMVSLIEDSARTLESLLSDVLDLAKIESGKLALRAEAFDLAETLRVTAALFEPRAREKGLAFETALPADLPWVKGDVTRIRQVVSNLLSNAVKFTAEGRVALTVDWRREGGNAAVTVTVADSGIGFDAETGQRLFQRFEQADGSITRRFGGTGLGLSISRSLTEAMEGELSAVSTPGAGAAFTFGIALPIAQIDAEIVDAETPAEPSAPVERAPRILLAEDHPVNRRVVELILQALGVDLTCVENGREAVDAAGVQDFDLILMDMQMPVMDGLTAIRLIRDAERDRGTPPQRILTLTANAMAEHAAASREAGADGHLTKPISADALIAAVEAACTPGDAVSNAA